MDLSTPVAVAKLNIQKAQQVVLQSRSDRSPTLGAGPAGTYVSRSPTAALGVETPQEYISGPGWGVEGAVDTKLFELPKLGRIVTRNSLEVESAELDLAQAQLDVTYNVMSAYYDVLFDQKSLELNLASETAAREHLKESQQLYQQGKIANFDVMRSEVRLANTQPQIIRSTRLLHQDQETLARLAGLDLLRSFNLAGELEQPAETFNFKELQQHADENRLDLKKMLLSEKIQDNTIKIDGARNPTTLQANGEYVHYDITQGGVNFPLSTYDVQLNLTVPLLGASHGHTRKQAKIQGEVISTQVGDLRLQIDTELAQDLTKLEESGEIIEVQSANVKLATESLRVGELSYQNGKTTSLDVEDSRQNLLQAQTDYLQAVHDYAIDLLDIRKAAGLDLNPPSTVQQNLQK